MRKEKNEEEKKRRAYCLYILKDELFTTAKIAFTCVESDRDDTFSSIAVKYETKSTTQSKIKLC